MKTLITVVFSTFILLSSSSNAELKSVEEVVKEARQGVEFIDNDYLVKRQQENPDLLLIDVRTKAEFDAGHIEGATWMERGIVEFRMAAMERDENREIIVYCKTGTRSALVAKSLSAIGYNNVQTHLGVETWLEGGHPIVNISELQK